MNQLADSYRYCRSVARRRARNFYYSFLLLPAAQRDAMCAVYAFMRRCDDLSDDPGSAAAARRAIERWREELASALEGRYAQSPLWPAFHDTVRRYRIPPEYFFEMIEGVSSDLEPRRFPTFEQLQRYCYQVASVVGLTIIHILGFHSPDALPMAESCGVAFQLTNILRDVGEDLERGRLYLPLEDLARFGLSEESLRSAEPPAGFRDLVRFEAARARTHYERGRGLLPLIEPASRPSLWALIEIYWRLLARIERAGPAVLRQRVELPLREKLAVIARAALMHH
ncbi:MAG: phytoene/squalene synthase family protein [Bryobacterales bacterium]|nr:phytoene/squalene synthase family protein [Bryobacteraceae bacterium]MDW8131879.1 phytoene/squalene synthase family protein [Bryobacterales bacterium]